MSKLQKTYSQKAGEVERNWYVIDAKDAVLGRLSTVIATKLIGKDKPTYTPHIDGGDNVIVINSDLIKVTGTKADSKVYYRHSGYPGNLKERTFAEQVERDSRKVIEKAVAGMLPKNKLQKERMARLKVFAGNEHNHEAQKPTQLKAGE